MNRIIAAATVLMTSATALPAFAATGTIQSPDPVWFSVGIVMSCVAVGIWLRAKRNARAQGLTEAAA